MQPQKLAQAPGMQSTAPLECLFAFCVWSLPSTETRETASWCVQPLEHQLDISLRRIPEGVAALMTQQMWLCSMPYGEHMIDSITWGCVAP